MPGPCSRPGKGVDLNASPLPVIDQPLQDRPQIIEIHLVMTVDALAVAPQLDGVDIESAVIDHGSTPHELGVADRETDLGRCSDNIFRRWVDEFEIAGVRIHEQVTDATEAVRCWQLFELLDEVLQFGASRRRYRELDGRVACHEADHQARLIIVDVRFGYLWRVSALAIETSPSIRLNMHPGADGRDHGGEMAIDHGEMSSSGFDNERISCQCDHATLERAGINGMTKHRHDRLIIVDLVFDAARVTGHVRGHEAGHLCTDKFAIQEKLLKTFKGASPAREGIP